MPNLGAAASSRSISSGVGGGAVSLFEKMLSKRQKAVVATAFSTASPRDGQLGSCLLFLENEVVGAGAPAAVPFPSERHDFGTAMERLPQVLRAPVCFAHLFRWGIAPSLHRAYKFS